MANYKDSMNLPKTDFPMRASLSAREPQWLDFWYANNIYEKAVAAREGAEPYILHDGPPYANGHIHMGTAFNKTIKDLIVKYKTMRGHYSPYVPGWDCHGQPIEHQIQKELGKERMEQSTKLEVRALCHDYALSWVDTQRDEFKRLGVFGDWEDPYLTLNYEYEAGNIEVFKKMYLDGAIYRGRKAVHWCIEDETVLAEAEIEYEDVKSRSLYVAFGLNENPYSERVGGEPVSILIWTTTAWTLPANAFATVNADADYVLVKAAGRNLILAEALLEKVAEEAGWDAYETIGASFKGSEIEGLTYKHPVIDERTANPIISDDYVEMGAGTGIVHGAGGHGAEDNALAVKHGLPIYMPVDDKGYFDEGAGPFEGLRVRHDDKKIIDWLRDERGTLVAEKGITHSYPHCWRCKNPVIFRATEQWFVSMEKTGLRELAIKKFDDIKWIPEWSRNRMGAMVADRPDWAISRQRSWGVPIPVHHCAQCDEIVANEATFDAIIALFNEYGTNAWYEKEPKEYLPEGTVCPRCGSDDLLPEQDIMDVWWESGVSHVSVLQKRPELIRPANLYLEGSDQHRGWFQSSYLTSLGYDGEPPYKDLMTCGFVVDGEGRKMSKSLGNVIAPSSIIQTYGADIIRLWVATTDYRQDMGISDEILKRVSDTYRRIRNSFRFMLSNLDDFEAENALDFADLSDIDKIELIRLADLLAEVTKHNDDFLFYLAVRALSDYLGDLSAAYFDGLKDRLYSEAPDSAARRSAQTVIREILKVVVRLTAPVLSFTSEEVWSFDAKGLLGSEESVHLCDWPTLDVSAIDSPELRAQSEILNSLRDLVTKSLEDMRNAGEINKSQEAVVAVNAGAQAHKLLSAFSAASLEEYLIVSRVELVLDQGREELGVAISKSEAEKCPRCWNYRELGVNVAYPEVCGRCAEALAAIGFSTE